MPLFTEQQSFDMLLNSRPGLRELLEAEEAEQNGGNNSGAANFLLGIEDTVGSSPFEGGQGDDSPPVQGGAGGGSPQSANPTPQSNDIVTQLGNLPQSLIGKLTPVAEQLYPTEPMNSETMQRFTNLSNRAQRLAPLAPTQLGEVGSARIQGNPYSTDNRAMMAGLSNVAKAIANRIRGNRREDFEGELSNLTQRYQQNQENQQKQESWVDEMSKKYYAEAAQGIRDKASDERVETRQTNLEKLRHQNDVALQKLKNDPNNPETKKMYISGINNYVKAANPGLELIPNQINNILRAEDYAPGPEAQASIDRLEEEYKNQSRRAAKMYEDFGVVPGSSDLRAPTDEEFSRIATMKLKGVPENIITDYAKDIGIRYIPPEAIDESQVTVDPEAASTDTTATETDFSDLFNEE